jgi:hypothetical protein
MYIGSVGHYLHLPAIIKLYQFRPALKQKHENVESGNISDNSLLEVTDIEPVIQTEINQEN